MAIAGQIEYKVVVDTKGLDKGLSESSSKLKAFGSNMASLGRAGAKAFFGSIAIGAINATGAIMGITKKATEAYADFEQLSGGISTLFGAESLGSIESFAKKAKKSIGEVQDEYDKKFDELVDVENEILDRAYGAYKTAGMGANEYMETITSFSASLIQSLNGDTAKAGKIADMAITDMSDNANKMGTSMEAIQNAYQGFAKQNYTMLDNLKLGYGGTKGEMERLLADAEKLSGKKYDISNLNDVFEAIHVIQTELGITGTTAKEAESTISGSLNMVKSSWKNVLLAVADDAQPFDEFLNNFVDSVGSFAKNIMPRLQTALKGAVRLVGELAPMIIEALPPLFEALLPAIVEATVGLMNSFIAVLPEIIQMLVGMLPTFIDAIMQIVNGILAYLPQLILALQQLVIGIANALIQPNNLTLILKSGITLLLALVKAVPELIQNMAEALPEFIDSIVAFLTEPSTIKLIIKAGIELFMGLVKAVPQILGSLFSAFATLIGNLWNRLTGLFKAFAGKFGDAIGGVFRGAINGVLSFIEGFVNAPIDIINGFIDTINGAFGAIGVNIGKIGRISLGRMATGGIVPSTAGGRLILAGEGGQDEWVVPESKMASMVEQLTSRANGIGAGQGVTINVYGTFATSDAEQRHVAEQIYDKLQEINKTRMGAYL